MWRRVPLNTKLIVALLGVQASSLAAGVFWLTNWTAEKRFKELQHRLDAQGDIVQSAIVESAGKLTFDGKSEAIRELNEDRNFYFRYVAADGTLLAESQGQSETERRVMSGQLRSDGAEHFYDIKSTSGVWIVQTESYLGGMAHVGTNAEPLRDEIAIFNRAVTGGAVAILLITSLGSGLVVSFSTRNLRDFAHKIRALKPPLFAGGPNLAPQSSEESLLFASYDELIHTVRAAANAQRLFIADASHELKTPIAAIYAALEVTLARTRSAADYELVCRDVFAEVKVLRRLSTHLLDLTRLEFDTTPDSSCTIADIALGVVARWQKAAAEKKIEIKCEATGLAADLEISGSPEEWEIILGNLVDNSVKYGKPGGIVEIVMREAGAEFVDLSIRDDGRGMTAEEAEHLGEVFFRADTARSGGESFGLGFAHAKRLVERLGGSVNVESHFGRGTNVNLRAVRSKPISS